MRRSILNPLRQQQLPEHQLDRHEHCRRAQDGGDMDAPELPGRHDLQPAADHADQIIGERQEQIIDADHGPRDRPRRGARIEREADRKDIGEPKIVERVDRERDP